MTSVAVIFFTWALLAALLLGLGHLLERAAGHVLPVTTRTIWLGLVALVAVLQIWAVVLPVDAAAWLIPAVASGAGWALLVRRGLLRRPTLGPTQRVLGGLLLVLALFIANRAALAPMHYDSGLYHLNGVGYAREYGTVLGLGNLHTRLGTSVSHFLVTAFAGVGPWEGAGHHVVNGGMAVLLCAETVRRCWSRATSRRMDVGSIGLAVPLSSMLLLLIFVAPHSQIASPSLDLPALVIVGAASLYLFDAVARREPLAGVVALGLAATAVSSRLQVALFLAVVVLWAIVRLVRGDRPERRSFTVGLGAASVIVLGALARTVMLSGYPLFPSTVLPFPVPFRVPAEDGVLASRWVRSWARTPGAHPDEVLGSWAWLGPWWDRVRHGLFVDAIGRMLVAGTVVALISALVLIYRRNRRPGVVASEGNPSTQAADEPLANGRAVGLVALANGVTVVAWFLLAPDLRFAFGSLTMLAACLVVALDLAFSDRMFPWSATAAGVAVLVWLPTIADVGWIRDQGGDGPFGTGRPRDVAVTTFTTDSGLEILVPASGDQCWTHLRCTPEPSAELELRGKSLEDGFTQSRDG